MGAKQFGARVARVEDPALLTGRARFVDDIKLPGLLHAAFMRSPHPHARILAIEKTPALGVAGVHAVLTASDLPRRLATEPLPTPVPNAAITALRTQHALARSEVCYVGEAIAVVIAESRYLAEDAALKVAVAFEPLPAVSDCRAALAPESARTHSDLATNVAARVPMSYGDIEAAFAGAAHVFEEELFLHRGAAMTLEGRAVLASQDAVTDVLTVWSATQTPHLCRRTIADLLGRELSAVRVIAPDVGGGFGTKAQFFRRGRGPGRRTDPRAADQMDRGPAREFPHRRRRSATSTGTWRWRSTATARSSACAARCSMTAAPMCRTASSCPHRVDHLAGPYVLPAFTSRSTVAFTNSPTAPVRGAGRPQAAFTMERLMDQAARDSASTAPNCAAATSSRPSKCPIRWADLSRRPAARL